MVEGHEEAIYEEITPQNCQHERSRSAPDIMNFRTKIRNRVCTSGTSSLRREKRQPNNNKTYDGYEKVIPNMTFNNSKSFEIYDGERNNSNSNSSSGSEEITYLHFDRRNSNEESLYVQMNKPNDDVIITSSLVDLLEDDVTVDSANYKQQHLQCQSIANAVDCKAENIKKKRKPPEIPIRTDLVNGSAHVNTNNYQPFSNSDDQIYNNFNNDTISESSRNSSYPHLSMFEQLMNSSQQEHETNQIYDNFASPTQDLLTGDSTCKPTLKNSDFHGIYSDIQLSHNRGSSDSSNGSNIVDIPSKTRSAEELGSNIYQDNEKSNRDTIYSEIVHSDRYAEISNSRITRQSENPILRNGFLDKCFTPTVKRAASLNQIDKNDIIYGEVDHVTTSSNRKKVYQASTTNRKSRPKSLFISNHHEPTPLSLRHSFNDLYENSTPLKQRPNTTPLPPPDMNDEKIIDFRIWEKSSTSFSFEKDVDDLSPRDSYYVNVDSTTPTFYEHVNNAESEVVGGRERCHSKPIEIYATQQSERRHDNNMVYSDVAFRKSSQLYSCSSSSITSSPRGSTCSSISSDFSFASNSISPPPLPNPRKRGGERYASWGNIDSLTGQNYYPAHYLGREIASKASSSFIDSSVGNVARNTNVLEMKPVLTEVNHECIRFGCNSSPWELVASFPIEEIISFDVVKKNAFFLGMVAGKPGEDAMCYVLQSDKAQEICEAIQEVFQTVSKIPRSQTLEFQHPTIEPEIHRYHFLVRIGSIKVKRSFHNVKDYIKIVLDKYNPKEFKNINMEIIGQNIVISEDNTDQETSHSTPSILTLAVYVEDKRYFGYIISETTPSGKPRVQCHVFRAARYETASKIIATISQSCQYSYKPHRASSNCDINPIYAQSKATYSNVQPRGSTSSSISSYATTPSGISSPTSSCLSSPASDVSSIKFPSRQNSTQENNLFTSSSTETLLTLTPSPSFEPLPRSSAVTSIYRPLSSINPGCRRVSDTYAPVCKGPVLSRSLSHDVISSHGKYQQEISHDENPIYQGRTEIQSQSDTYATIKDATKQPKHKKLFKKIRHSIKHKHGKDTPKTPVETSATTSFEEECVTLQREDIKAETYRFSAVYICSTVVSPPLKRKHVKECFKQYNKQVVRAEKFVPANDNRKSIDLDITTNNGITMVDPNQPEIVISHFTLDIIELFVRHPEEDKCFGISTSVLGNSKQHKCHLFCIKQNVQIEDISSAFEKMMSVKKLLNC